MLRKEIALVNKHDSGKSLRWASRLWLAWLVLLTGMLGRPAQSAAPVAAPDPLYRVNAPRFDGPVRFAETAILWFGRVDATHNWADLRVGYNGDELYLCLAAFDRRLWYDTSPTLSDLERWDAVTFYLRTSAGAGASPGPDDYRFVAQLNWWETRPAYQSAYRGGASGWAPAAIPFTTASGWRGNAPNDDLDDRGWVATLHIPFSSLGLSGAPAPGTAWSLGVALHDRDDAAGTAIADQIWPPGMQSQQPPTWGQLAFGMPSYSPPAATPGGMVVVRQGLNGATVPDAAVGGTTGNLCPGDTDYIWNHWGDANFAAVADFNIQNQGDVADWPCFARYYVTFPLDALPAGQAIISATLTLHQWGGSGGPGQAEPSLIQVLTVNEGWDEATLTWNNGPLARENVAAAWADPLLSSPGWPGAARTWDVSGAVAEAYAAGHPLRLALYEADSAYHSGKYFVSSDTGDWNAAGRPELSVRWGQPTTEGTPTKTHTPGASASSTATGTRTPTRTPTSGPTGTAAATATAPPGGWRYNRLPLLLKDG